MLTCSMDRPGTVGECAGACNVTNANASNFSE
jgi:hypothetical protein